MAYQIPQELQTKKLNSLPEDLRAYAEELIAKKFNLVEVVQDMGYGYDNLALDTHYHNGLMQVSPHIPANTLEIRAVAYDGKMLRLKMMLTIPIYSTYDGNEGVDYMKNQIAYETCREIASKLRHSLSLDSMSSYTDYIDYFYIQMNGNGQRVKFIEEIENLIYKWIR